MDDDVLLEPEILVRLTAFADLHDAPDDRRRADAQPAAPRATCTSRAEYAEPEMLLVGLPVPGALRGGRTCSGTTSAQLPINQERRVDTEYNGWWSCLIPAAIVRAIGYPLPLFFQWDDIEFGYRARAHGFPTVALPGAGVWHADFGWKDWDEWHRYFNMRNGLITAALHTGFSMQRIDRPARHSCSRSTWWRCSTGWRPRCSRPSRTSSTARTCLRDGSAARRGGDPPDPGGVPGDA